MELTYQQYYLSWVNDFITLDRFADWYGLSRDKAEEIIRVGRGIHEYLVAKQYQVTELQAEEITI